MGTRADFYIGRGSEARWLGSIAWDGYPEGINEMVLKATTENAFEAALAIFFQGRDDVTLPKDGWPWPWDDSCTTDCAYAFDDGKVWLSWFGRAWIDPLTDDYKDGPKVAVFPDMTSRKNVTLGKRSGVIVIGG